MDFIDILLSRFAPHTCVGCGQEGRILCLGCSSLLPDPDPVARDTVDGIEDLRAVTVYDSFAKDLIIRLKYDGAREAARVMASLMVNLMPGDRETVIIPVPTATSRIRQRGFDQADLIARHMARTTGLKKMNCLRRYGQTHQVGSSREARLSQLASSFKLKAPGRLKDRRIILIDDVVTTGATLEAAVSVLRAASPSRIEAIVFAQSELYLGDKAKNSIITPV